ncbi:MAG: N-acetylmannosamine-6-phosphate 2-epimerase [Candidatus Sericytochromatia bacterium]
MFNLTSLCGGLIVSCQPEAAEAFYTPDFAAGMAEAARLGGAVALRLNGPETIARIKAHNPLPIIGIWKQIHVGSDVYITPTLAAAEAILAAGAEILALDATARPRPAEDLATQVAALKGRICLMADVSTLAEGLAAAALGFDCLGTTLSGYTPYSPQEEAPDYALLQALVRETGLPVIMEGRIGSPQEARQALDLGAHAVVVGSAITRPQVITRRYREAMQG